MSEMRHRSSPIDIISTRISFSNPSFWYVTNTMALSPDIRAGSTHVFLTSVSGSLKSGLSAVRFQVPFTRRESFQIRSAVDVLKKSSIRERFSASRNGFSVLLCSKYKALTRRSAADRGALSAGRFVRSTGAVSVCSVFASCFGFVWQDS